MVRTNKNYGPISRIWEGPFVLHIMLSDPKHLEIIMNSQVHIEKPGNYDLFKPWIGSGLITGSGKLITYTYAWTKVVFKSYLIFTILNYLLDGNNTEFHK